MSVVNMVQCDRCGTVIGGSVKRYDMRVTPVPVFRGADSWHFDLCDECAGKVAGEVPSRRSDDDAQELRYCIARLRSMLERVTEARLGRSVGILLDKSLEEDIASIAMRLGKVADDMGGHDEVGQEQTLCGLPG